MKGLVLAAGRGSRLGELTARLPKPLLEVAPGVSILSLVLGNLAAIEIRKVRIVTGFASAAIHERVPELAARHDLELSVLENDHAEEWNNAYSMWLASDWFDQDTLLVNGDTVHPLQVEGRLMEAAARDDRSLLIAVDTEKPLGDEEMKVMMTRRGDVVRIDKGIQPHDAGGEYIGVSLIRTEAAEPLRTALEHTWRTDPSQYYEDAYQVMADRGHRIAAVPIGSVDWVEVDAPDDLARAREIACRY